MKHSYNTRQCWSTLSVRTPDFLTICDSNKYSKHTFYEEIKTYKTRPFLHIMVSSKDSLQQRIHFNGNIFGNKCCRCNEGSLYVNSTLYLPPFWKGIYSKMKEFQKEANPCLLKLLSFQNWLGRKQSGSDKSYPLLYNHSTDSTGGSNVSKCRLGQ